MELGTEGHVEVWFMPNNTGAYSPRLLTVCASVDAARRYVTDDADKYAGRLEIVRVTTTRQRVGCNELLGDFLRS